jgi:glycosyltransferase involved in cell wall biosynthesis
MASFFAISLIFITTALIVMHVVYVLIYLNRLWATRSIEKEFLSPDTRRLEQPERVAVVLCLRGADPSLSDCLAGLAIQTGPSFQLIVVVDSADDPALHILEQFQGQFQRLTVHTIVNRLNSCSLKCSAILTAIEYIPDSVDIIAFLDADTIPDPCWLSELIRPLNEPDVGASTGTRWFEAERPSMGTAVRQLWNMAAIVQMEIYNIAWGGSLAIRKSILNGSSLIARWGQAFCEDTLLSGELKGMGLRLVRVPNLIVVNRETTDLGAGFRWIVRQLLTVRLHNRNWPLIQVHAFATFCCSLALIFGLFYLGFGNRQLGLLLLVAWASFQIVNCLLLAAIERAVAARLRRPLTKFGVTAKKPSRSPARLAWAILLTQWVYPVACVVASVCRKVRWRGVEYKINRNGSLEMTNYHAFSAPGVMESDSASIL